jgi:hypothetical protein
VVVIDHNTLIKLYGERVNPVGAEQTVWGR